MNILTRREKSKKKQGEKEQFKRYEKAKREVLRS